MSLVEELTKHLQSMSPQDKAALVNLMQKSNLVGKRWAPTPGPQLDAYNSPADILLYGGQAGGGKSGLLIGLALNEHHRSLLMRRQYSDLGALIEDCLDKHGTRNGYSGQPPAKLRLDKERMIEFGGAKMPGDEEHWQGQPHDLLGLDEASQFEESQVRFLMGWVRSDKKDQRCRIVLATNPPKSPAEGQYLKKMFAPWLDPKFPNPAEPGELRWAISDENGEDVWVDDDSPRQVGGKMVRPLSRTFIPAALKDNPFLRDTGYAAVLDALPEPLRSAVRDGNWMIAHEDSENQVIPTNWIMQAQNRWKPTPPENVPMCAIGVDPAQGGSNKTVLAPRYDTYFAELVCVPGRETPKGSDVAALVFTERRHKADIVIDMGGGYGGGPKEKLEENGIKVFGFDGTKPSHERTADRLLGFYNKRAESWWKFREALDPDQPNGSPIALPKDPELLAQLAAPTFTHNPNGIKIQDKKEVKKIFRIDMDKADAVVMAWSWGPSYVTHGERWRKQVKTGLRKVVHSHPSKRRNVRRR